MQLDRLQFNLIDYCPVGCFLLIKRSFSSESRPTLKIDDRADNCREKVSWSLLKYMWGFENRVNPILNLLKQNYPDVHFIEINSDTALEKLTLT